MDLGYPNMFQMGYNVGFNIDAANNHQSLVITPTSCHHPKLITNVEIAMMGQTVTLDLTPDPAGERRIYASFKFFLYTLLGSVLMLIAIIFIYQNTDTMNIGELQGNFFTKNVQIYSVETIKYLKSTFSDPRREK